MPSQDSSMHSYPSSQQPSNSSNYAIQSILATNAIDSSSSNLNRQRQRMEETAALRRSADVFRRLEPGSTSLYAPPSPSTSSNANQAQLVRESERLRERERQRFQRERERDDRLLRDISSRAQSESQAARNSNQNASSNSSRSSGEQQHRVYLLNCKHCDNFLSDRGMKAVLLLKPNITLYSTDSTPTNCGPLWTPSRFGPGGGRSSACGEKPVERTCECLTQTLGCYGCGAAIGYSILSPCSRCTSSVVKHQRSSNGHRTVLHCSAISVRERRYVPGEPGVLAAVPPPPTNPFQSIQSQSSTRLHVPTSPHSHFGRSSSPYSFSTSSSGSSSPTNSTYFDPDGNATDSPHANYLDILEAEKAEAALAAAQAQANAQAAAAAAAVAAARASSSNKRSPRLIKRGDPVYWSDLVPGGERAEPFNPDPILDMPVAGR